ncbi:MAG: aminomethyl-transferring glycine dehydrogenase subunit GcvPA, partial [Gaiellaceae bacterium]
MGTGYLALTGADRELMLQAIGVASIDELFADIPGQARLKRELELPPPASELEVERELSALAGRNVHTGRELSFLGAGAYDHYVPAIVEAIVSRPEFLTAYTPYQPELSQGILQAIFEYQTVICELTGMEVSNASGYDGATVAADACFMASQATGRKKIAIAETVSPQVRQVVKTYAPGFGLEIVEVPHTGGVTDPEAFLAAAQGAAAAIFQQPNFFGCLEAAPDLAGAAAKAGALAVAHVDPLSLGVLEAPGNYGCQIAIGEGQAAGNRLSFGGPQFGFLAAKKDLIRRMPGRITGQTVDRAGRRGFVLTFQTREQHIRREKATSNICTNSGLCALAFTIHLALLGETGLTRLAHLNHFAAVRLAERLERIPGVQLLNRAFFNEFAVQLPSPAAPVVEALAGRGVLAGIPVSRLYPSRPELADILVVAATEMVTD